jgi:hypothetical protein
MNSTYWQEAVLNAGVPQNVNAYTDLAVNYLDNVFFTGTDNRIHIMYWSTNAWYETVLNGNAPANVMQNSDIVCDVMDKVYFVATDSKIHQYYYNSGWIEAQNSGTDVSNVSRTGLSVTGSDIYFVSNVNNIWVSYWACNNLYKSATASSENLEIPELAQNNSQVSIFPNPSTGFVTIKSSEDAVHTEIRIFDYMGKQLNDRTISVSERETILELPRGNYILEVKTSEGMFREKVIIM